MTYFVLDQTKDLPSSVSFPPKMSHTVFLMKKKGHMSLYIK